MKAVNVIDNILVAVDFSATSDSVVNVAAAIAKRHHAVVTLIHVVENSFQVVRDGNGNTVVMLPELVTTATDHLKRIANSFPGVVFHHIVQTGDPGDEICYWVLVKKVDLIVMGKGKSVSGTRLGRTLSRVIRHAPCPVLSIPEGFETTAFKKVVVPIDAVSQRMILKSLINIKDSHVIVLAIPENDQSNTMDSINHEVSVGVSGANENQLTMESAILTQDRVISGVLELIRKSSSDLVVISSGLDPYMRQIFPAANAQNIIRLSPCAVLTVHDDRQVNDDITAASADVQRVRAKIKHFDL